MQQIIKIEQPTIGQDFGSVTINNYYPQPAADPKPKEDTVANRPPCDREEPPILRAVELYFARGPFFSDIRKREGEKKRRPRVRSAGCKDCLLTTSA